MCVKSKKFNDIYVPAFSLRDKVLRDNPSRAKDIAKDAIVAAVGFGSEWEDFSARVWERQEQEEIDNNQSSDEPVLPTDNDHDEDDPIPY